MEASFNKNPDAVATNAIQNVSDKVGIYILLNIFTELRFSIIDDGRFSRPSSVADETMSINQSQRLWFESRLL
jgi:hypothetical protein